MSYHRGGHPGAVAVSYSTSTMSPLSPSRRYSGSTGSGTSVTSGTNSSGTSKYSSYRSSTPSNLGNDRNGGYYSSTSNTGYRAGSYTSTSSDTFRRAYYPPARSVSSYNESSSIVGSSSINGSGLRYGSASSSSASSTASSNSSCASRDRNNLQHHTAGSLATTAADLYAKYSPTNYVPNIHGSSKINNGNWRPSSSSSSSAASSSGISTSIPSELNGVDEYDSCRERRERSYSSDASSGIGLSSNGSAINRNNVISPSNERWTTRRETKRRPIGGNVGTSGNATNNGSARKNDPGSATIEVNISPVETTRNSINQRDTSLNNVGQHVPVVDLTRYRDKSPNEKRPDVETIDDICRRFIVTRKNDNRDADNNNADNSSNRSYVTNARNETDPTIGRDYNSETRRRRRRVNAELPINSIRDDTTVRPDAVNDDDPTNNVTLTGHNDSEEIRSSVGGTIELDKVTGELLRHDDPRQQRKRHDRTSTNNENNRKNGFNIPPLLSPTDYSSDVDSSLVTVNSSTSVNSLTSPSSIPVISAKDNPFNSTVTAVSLRDIRKVEHEDRRAIKSVTTLLKPTGKLRDSVETGKFDNIKGSTGSNDRGVDDVGGGVVGGVVVVVAVGGGSSAVGDAERKAFARTKIPTNTDNTELLTNNNVQDREVNLGIVETGTGTIVNETGNEFNDDNTSCNVDETRRREKTLTNVGGTRKALVWTATNEIDDDDTTSDVTLNLLTNGDCGKNDIVNGFEKSRKFDDETILRNNDELNDDETGDVGSLMSNGVRSTGSRSDDVGKSSTSRRTLFGWNDPTIDDPSGPSSSSASSSNVNNSVPVAVHQNLYRGLNEQIDESSNSRPPRSRLQSRRDERYGLNGLRNIGNTCFMNSVIQCLSNTRPLLEYLLNEQHLQDINTTTSSMKGALIKAFGQVIHELWEMSGDHVVNTAALKSQIQRFAPRFMGYSQQDAQEFLRYLLEGLHEDVNRVTAKPQPILTDIPDHYSDSHKASESWKRYLRSEDSTIVDVFVGQLRSSLHCTACDHVSVTLDPFWDLSLPIPLRLGTVKLNQCLEHFTKVETLDGDEKPTCSKCQMRRKCTKSFSIQKFPKILVIHLKRFSPTERFRGKLSVLVDFPLTCLDLSAFAAPGVQGCTYNLYGVANHSGTTYSGHYRAYCKHPYSGEWHEYNDSRVSSVTGRSVVSSEAYVLFYEQQPPSPHL